jgi:hypothetical protein
VLEGGDFIFEEEGEQSKDPIGFYVGTGAVEGLAELVLWGREAHQPERRAFPPGPKLPVRGAVFI